MLRGFVKDAVAEEQMSLDTVGLAETQAKIKLLIDIGETLARKYEAVVTNPPYMSNKGMNPKLTKYVYDHYNDEKLDMFAVMMNKCQQMCKYKAYYPMIKHET